VVITPLINGMQNGLSKKKKRPIDNLRMRVLKKTLWSGRSDDLITGVAFF
jgi:hypothetical protein